MVFILNLMVLLQDHDTLCYMRTCSDVVKKGGIEMRKRLLFISLVLALVLTTLMPAAALAAKPVPFYAAGTISALDEGTVFPAGESDRWRVVLREAGGSVSGSVEDGFTMTYKANVTSEQVGNLHGTLAFNIEPYVLRVNGKTGQATPVGLVEIAPGVFLPKLLLPISGHWSFIDGARGQGDFEGWVVFLAVPDEEGNLHVGPVYPDESYFEMTGQWQP